MTLLSVNINKVAVIRNSRGGNVPDVLKFALDCERFGADGITVHPRPDERHIRYSDVYELKKNILHELNVEGYPSDDFINMVCDVVPHQVTLVPDLPEAITSNSGWHVDCNRLFLEHVISRLHKEGIRVSLFVDTDISNIKIASSIGADRIELYTERYANNYKKNDCEILEDYFLAAKTAQDCGLGVNAGHDLNLDNLKIFSSKIPFLDEVSIGHALISDSLYLGIENAIQLYKKQLVNV